MKLVTMKKTVLKNRNDVNERMIQDYIAEHPECLELGNLELKDRERPVQDGGFIDLLFKDVEDESRYIVEVQLGDADASHMFRVADYVFQETKRCPRCQNIGVLIAENVTTSKYAEFLLQSYGPKFGLIVIQMNAKEMDNGIVLDFIKVLDSRNVEVDEELEEDVKLGEEPITREWYIKEYGNEPIRRVDVVMEKVLTEVDDAVTARYRKNYIGLDVNGLPRNWVAMWPHKRSPNVDIAFKHISDADEMDQFRQYGLEAKIKKVYNKKNTVVTVGDTLDEDQISLLQEIAQKSREEYYATRTED